MMRHELEAERRKSSNLEREVAHLESRLQNDEGASTYADGSIYTAAMTSPTTPLIANEHLQQTMSDIQMLVRSHQHTDAHTSRIVASSAGSRSPFTGSNITRPSTSTSTSTTWDNDPRNAERNRRPRYPVALCLPCGERHDPIVQGNGPWRKYTCVRCDEVIEEFKYLEGGRLMWISKEQHERKKERTRKR